jgi:hypothetical protein
MEIWRDYADAAFYALIASAVVVLIACVIFSIGAFLYSLFRRSRERRSFRTVLWRLRWVPLLVFALAFPAFLLLCLALSDSCGTSQANEFPSPDGKHRIVIYAFDCGATTDFSLVVSLLDGAEVLPKHRTPNVLYSRYHDEPSPGEFEVLWQDAHHVTVRLVGYDGEPSATEDGVTIRFEENR